MNVLAYDNTALSNFKRCARYSYFRDVKHWVPDMPSAPLAFGSSWGRTLDVVFEMLCGPARLPMADIFDQAMLAFEHEWTDLGMPSSDSIDGEMEKELSPRTPKVAAEMLTAYLEERQAFFDQVPKLVGCEVPFIIPLDDEGKYHYCGLLDKLLRHRGKVLCIDHKSTGQYKKEGYFKSTFMDSFSPNSQVDGYLFALHKLFPGERPAVWIDAALVHKTVQGFSFIPIEKQFSHLEAWRWEALHYIKEIEQQKVLLADVASTDAIMKAFPKNTNSCFAYNTACPYMDLCRAWPNPKGFDLPPGFKIEEWKPLERSDHPVMKPT